MTIKLVLFFSDKEYSREQMKESTAILNKINSFIEFTNAYCNGFMRDLNFELNEGELFSLLEKTKTNVDNALNNSKRSSF